jgi:hypothetical protein
MKGGRAIPLGGAVHSTVSREEERAQLERILRSQVFRLAPGLQKFLEFVGSKTIEGLSHEIKEYTIGTEVFGRSGEYDPKIDTVVRVQAHRLREKLKEYYSQEGAEDDILVAVPKGHYVPCFSRRGVVAGADFENPQLPTLPPETAEPAKEAVVSHAPESSSSGYAGESKKRFFSWRILGVAGTVLLLGAGLLLLRLRSDRSIEQLSAVRKGTSSTTIAGGPLSDLWAGFLGDESSPVVAYSNALFLTTETSDLLRLKSEDVDNLGAPAGSDVAKQLLANPGLLERAGPVFFEDLYTGTGEVMAVFYLTRMFSQFRTSLEIKRSRLVTTDDLARHNVIFLGSTVENALLAGLPLTQDFVFVWPPRPGGAWKQRIANLHPQPGESSSYEVERDPATSVLRGDYGLVSFLPGISPNRRIVILGGLTTLGTQAAAEFATSPSQIAELVARNGSGSDPLHKKVPPFFQAVIRAEIMKGDILNVKYVTGHVIPPPQYTATTH